MGAFSIWHWVIVLVIVLVLFGGRGKIANIMGDIGKGLKDFKKNVKDEGAQLSQTSEDEGTADKTATKSDEKPKV